MLRQRIFSWFSSQNVIQLGIGFIALLIIHNFVVAYFSQNALEDRNEFLGNRQFILQKIDQLSSNVNLIDLGVRGYYMINQDNLKDPLEIARTQHRADIDTLLYFMEEYAYPEIDSIHLVDTWIAGYFDLADQGVSYIAQGMPEQTAEIYRSDPGYTLWSQYSLVQNSLRAHINALEQESSEEYASITGYALFAQMLLLVVGGVILLVVVFRLARQKKAISTQFARIGESDKAYVFNDGKEHLDKKQGEAISRMEEHLKTAAGFIKQITTGDLSANWPGMTKDLQKENSNTLAGELITMRDQMAQVKQEEQERLWISEGISQFSEIIRTHQSDMQTMSDTLISGIVKYLECNQGGLFFIDDEKQDTLHLTSCYAYDKTRFVEKSLSVDEGMVGQAFKEGEMIILKQIPENYVNITSGLGESLPRHLAIIPLKVNESIEGVMELASFTEFTKNKIELLNKISEIVASAVFNSRNATEMKRLLQEAEENTAALRAQEEEMRQNMEEMQAMQENDARQA